MKQAARAVSPRTTRLAPGIADAAATRGGASSASALTLAAVLGLLAVLALPAPAPAAAPPGISLEIGNTPGERPRGASGGGAPSSGAAGTTGTTQGSATPDGVADAGSSAIGPLHAVTGPGEAAGSYRRWGHLIGDRLRACVALAPGQRANRVPIDHDAGRVGLWFERQATRTIAGEGGRALCIDYQVINAPRATLITILPAVTLAADDGAPLTIPATSVSIGPLIPDIGAGPAGGPAAGSTAGSTAGSAAGSTAGSTAGSAADSAPTLIDDREAARFVTPPDPATLGRSAVALGLVLAGWLGFAWWQRAQDRLRQPFAGALHDLHRLRRQGAADSPRAWQRVHEAINRSAGRTVSSAGLPSLIEDLPWLAPLASRLVRFFEASDARFFAQAAVAEPFALEALCADLRRVERAAGFEVAPRRVDDDGAAADTDATRAGRAAADAGVPGMAASGGSRS